MAASLAIILLLGLVMNRLFESMKLPGLLGMLIAGTVAGPYVLDIIDPELLAVSSDLRKIALIIILLRAGLGLKKDQLNKIGISAAKMSMIPGLFEGAAVAFLSARLFGLSFEEAGMLGFIIAAVSPAVIVPLMLDYIERKKGEKNAVPTLILAGASIDDVFAITIFSAFLAIYRGTASSLIGSLLGIPISILLGIISGIIAGAFLVWFFKTNHTRDTKKVLIILGVSILLNAAEDILVGMSIPFASLLGVMTIGFIILERDPERAKRLSVKFNKVWVFAEILLFVLLGAQVNISVLFDSGAAGLVVIAFGLLFRSLGVLISLAGSPLTKKERLFCIIAYTPKATVQAAIGAVPLSFGVPAGDIILAVAVLSIAVTAPLGAIGIRFSAQRLLD